MSSNQSPSDDARGESIWHPAREWLEEDDDLDMDYHPALEGSNDDDEWEEEADNEDEEINLGISDGTNDNFQGY